MTDEQIKRFVDDLWWRDRQAHRTYKEEGYEASKVEHIKLDGWIAKQLAVFESEDPLPTEMLDVSKMSAAQAAFYIWRVIATHMLSQPERIRDSPSHELLLLSPSATAEHFGRDPQWCICWESGPYHWGERLSGGEGLAVEEMSGTFFPEYLDSTPEIKGVLKANRWYIEPHYSFDINFVES